MSRSNMTRKSKKRDVDDHPVPRDPIESELFSMDGVGGSSDSAPPSQKQRRISAKQQQTALAPPSVEAQQSCPPPPPSGSPVSSNHQVVVVSSLGYSGGVQEGLQVQHCLPNGVPPLNAQLLSCFGGFSSPHLVNILEHFFVVSLRFGREEVVDGLVTLSNGMVAAIEMHNRVKNDFRAVSSRAERIYASEQAAELLCTELRHERDNLKVAVTELQKENKSLHSQLSEIQANLKSKETETAKIGDQLKSAEKEIAELNEKIKVLGASKDSEISEMKKNLDKQRADHDLRIKQWEVDLREVSERLASVMSNFTDPVTKEPHQCPVIQTNGVIRSLSGIIEIWLKESNMGQSNAFRMFKCPVQQNFTMIASFPIVDSILKLAGYLKLDVSLPISFLYKAADDSWAEFSFHEQLELIARLCDVYHQRANSTKPPEQRNVSVGGMSFLISMHAITKGKKSRLECFGIHNNGNGKVEIKVNFRAGWDHPFVDMEFPIGL